LAQTLAAPRAKAMCEVFECHYCPKKTENKGDEKTIYMVSKRNKIYIIAFLYYFNIKTINYLIKIKNIFYIKNKYKLVTKYKKQTFLIYMVFIIKNLW
jgi:hypothetical protein